MPKVTAIEFHILFRKRKLFSKGTHRTLQFEKVLFDTEPEVSKQLYVQPSLCLMHLRYHIGHLYAHACVVHVSYIDLCASYLTYPASAGCFYVLVLFGLCISLICASIYLIPRRGIVSLFSSFVLSITHCGNMSWSVVSLCSSVSLTI